MNHAQRISPLRRIKGPAGRARSASALLAVAVAVSVLHGCSASKVEVSWEYDEAAAFSGLTTYAWVAGPQERTKDPRIDDPFMVKRLRSMIEKRFAAHGYTMGSPESADFLIAYSAALHDARETASLRGYSGYARAWGDDWGRDRGWNVGGPPITNIMMYDIGSLNLYIVGRSSGEPIWHAVAQAKIHPGDSRKERDERLARAVDEMLKHFPPKAGAADDE